MSVLCVDQVEGLLVPPPPEMSCCFDAIVAPSGGDFTLPSAAFAAGARTVCVKEGTYVEVADVVIPSGGVLVGEGDVVINLSGGFRVDARSVSFNSTSAGTVAVSTGSTTVAGTGTTFTALAPGDFIRLGAVFHEIATITDDTTLDLVEPYQGAPLTGLSFLARTMVQNVRVENLTLRDSTAASSLRLLGVKGFIVRGVDVVNSGAPGTASFAISQCTEGEVLACTSRDSTGAVGITLFDSTIIRVTDSVALNGVGRGMGTNGCREIMFINCTASQNGGRGFFFNNDFRVGIMNSFADDNITNGIHADDMIQGHAIGCMVRRNGSEGILMSESPNFRVIGCQSEDSGGVGIEARNEATISGCVVLRGLDIGICARETSANVLIENNRVIDPALACIDLESSAGTISGNRVSGGTDGIFLDTGAFGSLVEDNICNGGTGQGINVDAPDCIIDGNRVTNFGDDGINFAGSADRFIASNNRSQANGGDGLQASVGADTGIITSNQLQGNTGLSLNDLGAGNVVANNQV